MLQDNALHETVVDSNKLRAMSSIFSELWAYRMLAWVFTVRDIKVKYTRTKLGLLWILISPLVTVGVFTFVFGLMIKVPSDGLPYLLFYLVAIIPWYFFISTVNLSMVSVEGNAELFTKIYFPRLLLACSYTLSSGIDFLVGYVTINICAIIYGYWNYKIFAILPVLLIIEALFAMGIGLFLAPLVIRFRDVKHAVPMFLQLYYFANPLLYSVSSAPQWIKPWYDINPMSIVINGYRLVLKGQWPELPQTLIAFAIALLVFGIGLTYFRKHESRMVDFL